MTFSDVPGAQVQGVRVKKLQHATHNHPIKDVHFVLVFHCVLQSNLGHLGNELQVSGISFRFYLLTDIRDRL